MDIALKLVTRAEVTEKALKTFYCDRVENALSQARGPRLANRIGGAAGAGPLPE